MSETKMKLKCWDGGWNLPSIDIDSLSVICYSHFTKAPLEIVPSLPINSITGSLPELEVKQVVQSQLLQIINIFRREGYNADFVLSDDESADTLAFLAYIQQKLKPALLYTLWLDAANFTKVMRPALAKSCKFPWSFWYPSRIRKSVEHRVLQSKSSFALMGLNQFEKIIYKEAQECMSTLDKKLGNKEFFFGKAPSTLDAVAFGHLGMLLKAPLVSTELQNHLRACGNLVSFCQRIDHRFLKMANSETAADVKTPTSVKEFYLKKDQVITIAAALGAMVLYAFTSGVLTSRGSKLAERLRTRRCAASQDLESLD